MMSTMKKRVKKRKSFFPDDDDSFVKKRIWTNEEKIALVKGVQKFGKGKWARILKNEELWPVLRYRSNVDLKDKVSYIKSI